MSKNMLKKTKLWSILVGIVLVAALVVGIVFGFNNANVDNRTALTVTMDRYVYNADLDDVKAECQNVIGNVDYEVVEGSMSGNVGELVYFFDADEVSFEQATAMKDAINTKFSERVNAEDDKLFGFEISATVNGETLVDSVAKGYTLRGAIAIVVVAVLAFAYVAIRYNVFKGILACASVLLGVLLTTAVAVLTRIPVANSLLYAIAFGGLLSLVNVVMNLAKEKTETETCCNVATKEISALAICLGVAFVLVGVVGIITNMAILWFALLCLVATAVAAFVGLIYAPILNSPLEAIAAEQAEARSTDYKGAKKTSTKEKKVFVKEEVKAEEPETVEEAKEETTESVVEETTEEPVEEVEEIEETETTEETVETEEETAEETEN